MVMLRRLGRGTRRFAPNRRLHVRSARSGLHTLGSWYPSGRISLVDPPTETFDLIRCPGDITWHRSIRHTVEDRRGIRLHILILAQIEREPHLVDVLVTEQRSDITCETRHASI